MREFTIVVCLNALLFAAISTLAQGAGDVRNPGVPWPAADALGRSLPLASEVGTLKPDRTVGIFYFLTHSETSGKSPNWDGPYDIARIYAADPDALKKPDSPLWGPIGMFHYWGEPLFGYYRSDDPWVLRRHAQLLADAGVDTLIFDTTNAVTYPDVYHKLCEVFSQVRREGGRTPQICFMVNSDAGKTAERIYEDLYKPNLYPELWFRWQGKPLMICDPNDASPELKAFFTLRAAHWPFTLVNTPYAWHWEATYPQPYGYTDDAKRPEEINVSVAQNLRAADGKVTNMSFGDARGRSFHDGEERRAPGSVDRGYNFQEQWKRVFDLNPPFVMVTGWNEWTAGRFGTPGGPITFVDQFDEEFSRDIEPMKGGHADDYYYQLVANVRRYKGAPPLPKPSGPKRIDVNGSFDQWRNVSPEFHAEPGASIPRDHDGVVGLHYRNEPPFNEFELFKVARDSRNVTFYVRTRRPLTEANGARWIWLLISTGSKRNAAWNGYDFLVRPNPDGAVYIYRHVANWNWATFARVGSKRVGREWMISIPRDLLGFTSRGKVQLDFKWVDNWRQPGNIMDLYVNGESAPIGRFNFRYTGD